MQGRAADRIRQRILERASDARRVPERRHYSDGAFRWLAFEGTSVDNPGLQWPTGWERMKIVRNAGDQRVLDLARPGMTPGAEVDIVSSAFSLFAFGDLHEDLSTVGGVRMVLPPDGFDLSLLGGNSDRSRRNQLKLRWLAATCADWLSSKVEVRRASFAIPQGALVVREPGTRWLVSNGVL